jgi:hypothetical protein
VNYNYEEQKKALLTERGQEKLLAAHDIFIRMLKETGAATKGRLFSKLDGDSFESMAVIDRLVEIHKWTVLYPYPDCPYQYEVVVLPVR